MKRIVITGGTGQVGHRLARQLARNGLSVTAIGSDPAVTVQVLGNAAASVRCLAASDHEAVAGALSGADMLFHCAFARGHEGHALARSLDYASGVFSLACAGGTEAIVNLSSQSVYGSVRANASTEEDPVNPGDRYALAKYASERLLAAIATGTSTRHTQVRLASLIGDGMDERLVTKFVAQAMAGKPLRIQGGAQRFAFLDMEDAIAGLALMTTLPPGDWKPVYNLAPVADTSLLEIAEAVASGVEVATGRNVAIEISAEGNQQEAALDGRSFARDFNFVPRRGIHASIAGIIASRDWDAYSREPVR